MQLHIRGNLNYVLEFATGNESCAELKAKIAEKEGSEDVLLYVAGKPVDYEMPVSSIGDFHVDVTVPLLGGKVRIFKKLPYINVLKFMFSKKATKNSRNLHRRFDIM